MKIDYDGLKRAIICSSLTQRQIAQLSGIHEQTNQGFMGIKGGQDHIRCR